MLQNILWTRLQFVIVVVFLVIGLLICQMHKSNNLNNAVTRCDVAPCSPSLQTCNKHCVLSPLRAKLGTSECLHAAILFPFALLSCLVYSCHMSNLFAACTEPFAHGSPPSHAEVAVLGVDSRFPWFSIEEVKCNIQCGGCKISWMKATLVFWSML